MAMPDQKVRPWEAEMVDSHSLPTPILEQGMIRIDQADSNLFRP